MSKTNKIIIALLAVATLLAIFNFFSQSKVSQNENLTASLNSSLPAGTPTDTAPEMAIESCEGKIAGEECQYKINGNINTGQCYVISDKPVCGPKESSDI